MSKFTFLTKEQCFGDNKLDVIRKRGIKAAITDFAILLGGMVLDIDDDNQLSGMIGSYWTKSKDVFNRVCTAQDGKFFGSSVGNSRVQRGSPSFSVLINH